MIRTLMQRIFHRQAPWFERYFIWLLLGGALLAMLISLAIGLQQSVWFDEAYSIMLAKQPIGELLHLTSIDTHPPLYYLLLKAWAGVFGWSELALRSLSVVALGGAVVVAGLFVRRFFGVRAALMTLPFIVLAPFLLRFGFEIRMYALASLIGIAATYALAAAVEAKNTSTQWKLYALYAVLVALGVYTLYYTALLWITHVVWLLWLARSQRQPLLKQRWWAAYAGSVVLFLPWLPTFVAQLGNGALAPIAQQMTVENMVGVISFSFLYQPSWQLTGITSLIVVGVIVALVYLVMGVAKSIAKKQKPYFVLVALYAFVPIAIITLISLARPMYVERYLAQTLLGMILLVGVSLWYVFQKERRQTLLVGTAFVAVLTLGIANLAQVGNYNFQRLQVPQVKQAVNEVPCDDGAILAADPYVAIELAYYLPGCDIHFYSDTANLRGGYAPLAHSPLRVSDPAELAMQKRVTYVYYDEPKLEMAAELRQVTLHSYGPLHVASYSAQ